MLDQKFTFLASLIGTVGWIAVILEIIVRRNISNAAFIAGLLFFFVFGDFLFSFRSGLSQTDLFGVVVFYFACFIPIPLFFYFLFFHYKKDNASEDSNDSSE
jgi:hypothetical protein